MGFFMSQKIQPIFLTLFMALLFSGCMTEQMIMPSVISGTALKAEDAAEVGLSKVQDLRANQEGGSIGGLKIVIAKDLGDYLEGVLKEGLILKGFKVVDAVNPQESGMPDTNVILVSLKAANISTFDSVMAPAVADIALTVQVYGKDGKVTFAKSFTADNSKRLWFTAGGKKIGRVMAVAADQVTNKILTDQEFLNAIGAGKEEEL